MSLAELRCSLEMAADQPPSGLFRLVGSTQASRVMPFLRSRDAASGMVTREVLPLKDRAPPYLPAADQIALLMLPSLPLPERSCRTAPPPSSKLYAATSPF